MVGTTVTGVDCRWRCALSAAVVVAQPSTDAVEAPARLRHYRLSASTLYHPSMAKSDGPALTCDPATQLSLRSLAPQYKSEAHGVYVSAIRKAIDEVNGIRNIALTGAYGTGKSSILSEVVKCYRDRVVEVSLSSVGRAEPSLEPVMALG